MTTAIRYAWLALSAALLPVVYGVAFEHVPVGIVWLPLSLATIPIMRHYAKKPERRTVDVRIDAGGIHVDGKRVVHRRHIRSGAAYTAKNGDVRVVFRHRRTLASVFGTLPVAVFLADHVVQADQILAAAGVDLERRVFRTTFLRPQAAWQVVLGLAMYAGLSFAMLSAGWRRFGFVTYPVLDTVPFVAVMVRIVLAAAMAFGTYALVARTTVTIGMDGIEIRRAFRRRFVPMDEIRDARPDTNVLTITLVSGERITVAHAAPLNEPVGNFGTADIAMERALLADRIRDAVRMHERRSRRTGAILGLGRGSRSRDAWWTALRAIGMGASDYRTGAVPIEEIRRALTDTSATDDVRVGAAIALRVADGPDAVKRIRIAADATAAPDLRSLLEDIAGAGDDDLRGCLARLGADR